MALDGKCAIVTGAASGIGYAIAERFLREGAKVMFADIDVAKGERAEADLKKLGDARFVKADVSRRLDAHNLVAAAVDAFGDIDILVNNAGIVHGADFLDLKEEDFDRVIGVGAADEKPKRRAGRADFGLFNPKRAKPGVFEQPH